MSGFHCDVVSRLKAHGLAVSAAGVDVQVRIRYWHPKERTHVEFLLCFNDCEKCDWFWHELVIPGSTFEVAEILESSEASAPFETQHLTYGA